MQVQKKESSDALRQEESQHVHADEPAFVLRYLWLLMEAILRSEVEGRRQGVAEQRVVDPVEDPREGGTASPSWDCVQGNVVCVGGARVQVHGFRITTRLY